MSESFASGSAPRRRKGEPDVDSAKPAGPSEKVTQTPQWVMSRPSDREERLARAVTGGTSGRRGGDDAPSTVDAAAVRPGLESPSRPLAPGESDAAADSDRREVRVHSDGAARSSARALGAAAYTVGNNVVLGDGYAPGSTAARRLMRHELVHVAQARSDGARQVIRRDLAVAPTAPAVETMSDAAATAAVAFNRRVIVDPAEIALLRDILGVDPAVTAVDEEFSRAVARFQSGNRLSVDGRVGPVTRRALSLELLAEERGMGAAPLGRLNEGVRLRVSLDALITAADRNYAHYRGQIVGATLQQRDVCLADVAFLRRLEVTLAWDDFARCVELFGRRAPHFAALLRSPVVRSALRPAWTDSHPAVTPPGTGQHEEGGWVYLNLLSNTLSVRRQAAGAQAAINLSSPPIEAHSIVVAKFHTHPNLGPQWLAGPSAQDAIADGAHGVPDIVVGNTGLDPAVFQTFASGPDGRAHLAGGQVLPGAAGGLAPQAKIDGTEDEQ